MCKIHSGNETELLCRSGSNIYRKTWLEVVVQTFLKFTIVKKKQSKLQGYRISTKPFDGKHKENDTVFQKR
jgi:hypothetical protein